jgi:hypothetical protein
MPKPSPRIRIFQEGEERVMEIQPVRNVGKTKLMLGWLMLWLACGAVVVWQLWMPMPRENKLILFVYLAFWAYFAFRVWNAFWWRKNGVEIIRLSITGLTYEKRVNGRGLPMPYSYEGITSLQVSEPGKSSFAAVMEDSYWVIGAERLVFFYNGKKIGLGLQLSKKESEEVFRELEKSLKLFRKRQD